MKQYNFSVDADTREISIDNEPIIVKGDVEITQYVFTVPKVIHGIDMSEFSWRIWYTIATSTHPAQRRHFYPVSIMEVSGDNLVITWEHDGEVARSAGVLSFALSALTSDSETGEVTAKWNSLPYIMKVYPTVGGGVYTSTDAEQEFLSDLLVEMQQARDTVVPLAEQVSEDAQTVAEAKETAVSASTSAVTANTQAQAAKEAIDTAMESFYSLGIVESASGDPATLSDGSNGVPMKSVSVGIEPKQDLNGYEFPWVGGSNKNLLDTKTVTKNGVTFTADADGYVTASPSNSDTRGFTFAYSQWTVQLKAGTYNIDWEIKTVPTISGRAIAVVSSSGTLLSYTPNYTASGTSQFTISEDTEVGVVAKIFDGAIRFQIRKSTDAQAWSPYSNICPISGWDEVKVTRTGKNLFAEPIVGSYINDDGTISSLGNSNWRSDVIPLDGQQTSVTGTIYVRGTYTGSVNAIFFDENMQMVKNEGFFTVSNITTFPSSKTITIPSTARYMYFRGYMAGGSTSIKTEMVQIEFGSARTDYEAYNGQTYPISLTSAGTVYGGTLDVATGELVVDRAIIDLGIRNWTKSDNAVYAFGSIPNMIANPTIISDSYQVTTNNMAASNLQNGQIKGRVQDNSIFVRDDRYTTSAEYKSGLSGCYIVYELATPLTYTLTPSQITSLLGTNHVWADCGEISCEYVADTKMYIQNLLNQ